MPPSASDIIGLLLILSGDVESNPGPPRRVPRGAPEPKKEAKEPEQEKSSGANVREYDDRIGALEKTVTAQKKEIEELKATLKEFSGVNDEIRHLKAKLEAVTEVFEDLNEKMFEIDKTRKNNLLFYGVKPDFLPEIPSQLEQKIQEIIKFNLRISRDIPLHKIGRMMSGPEVRGCHPVVVNFTKWKDREEILQKSKLLKGQNIYITEDLSRKMREHRHELAKYMRQVRAKSPNKKCTIVQDKLYIGNTMYVFDEERNEVVRYVAPPLYPRAGSSLKNYQSVGLSGHLTRSTSVHSVEGHPDTAELNGVGAVNGRYASAESLQDRERAENTPTPTRVHFPAMVEELPPPSRGGRNDEKNMPTIEEADGNSTGEKSVVIVE